MIKKTTSRKPRAAAPVEPAADVAMNTVAGTSMRMSPVSIIVIVAVLGVAAVLFAKNAMKSDIEPSTNAQVANTPQVSMDEIQALIAKVSAHLDVIPGESPTIATIQNADVLRAQSPVFYKDAKIGDRLLIWSDKAVLYSPTEDKILAVLPISLPPSANATSTAPVNTSSTAVTPEGMIEIRNGSGVAGLGRTTATKLKAAGFTVLPATDAKSRTPYQASIIVAGPNANAATVTKLQQETGAQVTQMPAVEGTMTGDLLLILGLDAAN